MENSGVKNTTIKKNAKINFFYFSKLQIK